MPPLTKELSQASPVGTDILQGKVVDTSAAQFLQDVSSTVAQARQTFEAIEGRTAEAAVSTAVEETDQEFNTTSIDATISGELAPVERLKQGVRQGQANKDRFVTELDAKIRKLKARFPGHTDLIDKKARRLLGFDPRVATRDIVFREEVAAADELKGLVNASVQAGTTVFNRRGDASSGVDEVATANATQAFFSAKRLAETSAAAINVAKTSGNNKEMTESVMKLENSLEASFGPQLDTLTSAFSVYQDSITTPEEDLAFIRAGKRLISNMLASTDDTLSVLSNVEQDRVRKTIEGKLAFLERGLGTDLESFSRLNETMVIKDQLLANFKVVTLTDMENISVINEAFGQAAGSIIGGQLLNSELRKKVQDQIERELATVGEGGGIQSVQRAIAGRITLIEDIILSGKYGANAPHLSDLDKQVVVEEAWDAAVGYTTEVLDERSVVPWGNTWQALNDTYTSFIRDDVDNLPKLIDNILSPTFNANLNTLQKTKPLQAASIVGFVSNVFGDSAIVLLNPKGNFLTTSENISQQLKVIQYNPSTKEFEDTLAGSSGIVPSRVRDALPVLNSYLNIIRTFGIDEQSWVERLGVKTVGEQE